MRRILVAVDGSEPSRRAARRAAEIAPKLGLTLSFIHVVPSHALLSEWRVGGDEREMRELRREEGLSMLSRLARDIGVDPELICVEGTPAEAIDHVARNDDVELLALGSRGRTLIGGILIGSVAHRLVHICRKAILVVH
jgi:nucleotide-binding universal stress UspA family protein